MIKLFFSVALIAGIASCKKQDAEKMTVVRDCTGTYLRHEGKDYLVCNLEKLAPYEDGAFVMANFRKISECDEPNNDVVVCYMYHPNEGWINVEYVRK